MIDDAAREFVGNGRYAMDRLLGAGGAGAVNLAYDTMLTRWVAIKRMPAGDKTVLREATVIASLQHPNIVMIHDIFEQGAEVFFVMELVLGPTLEELAEGMNEETFRDFAGQCLHGLGAAHEQNVVHRDVKPGNIMLSPLADGSCRVKLLDFGQSRAMEEPSLQTIDHNGAVVGSIYMMSPEQLSREPLDFRTDLYSLGCVFYQALTLQRPFAGGSVPEVCAAHFQHRYTPLRNLRPDLPIPLTMWVEKLFSFDRRDRPASAAEALLLLKETPLGTGIRVVSPLDRTAPVAPVLKRTQSLILPVAPIALRPKPLSGAAAAPMLKSQAVAIEKPEVLAAQEEAQEGSVGQNPNDPPEHADAALTSSDLLDSPTQQTESPETPAAIYTPPPGEYVAPEIPQTLPRRIWRRLTEKRFLFISVVAHLLLGIIAAIFVVQSITAKRKLTFTSAPPSPNKSQRALEHKVTMAKKQNTMSAPAQAKRITSTGIAKVSLPDMPAISSSTDFNAGKMAGMGGTGVGLGFKGGLTSSGGKGALGGPISFFGMRGKNENVLRAKFYDLKQTRDKKSHATPVNDGNFYAIIKKFVTDNDWNPSYFSKYYCAPIPIFSPRVYIPADNSLEAPKAFGVEKNVAPGLWLIHYKGRIRALKKGTFRFVGSADNVIVVRLNKKNALCATSYVRGVVDPTANSNPPEMLGVATGPGCQLEAGRWFEVNQGQTLDIEILIGDDSGQFFNAYLFYQEMGVNYPKRPDGSGFVFPIFEFDGSRMPPITKPNIFNPPFLEKSERLFEGMKAPL